MNEENLTRRNFLAATGTAALATSLAHGAEETSKGKALKILGIACSPRKGMTTAKAVQTALDAAASVDSRIQTELIDLGGLSIAGWSPKPPKDDFESILPKLQDPAVAGLIFGSPSYYRSMSSLCKAFIERCGPLREPKLLLADKPVGVVALGGMRNGGQELVIQQIQTAMLSFGMLPVGGNAPAFQGGTLVSAQDSVAGDEAGLDTARRVGLHVGGVALKLVGGR